MHRFGDQIELRVDRRHVLLFFFGAVFWTLVAFFFGMLVAGGGKVRTAEKGLAALGWLDQHAQKKLAVQRRRQAVGFSFATRRPAPHTAVRAAAAPSRRSPPAQAPRVAQRVAPHEPNIPSSYAVPGYDRRPPRRRAPARQPLARLQPPSLAVRHKGQWTYRIAMRISRKAKALQLMRQFQRKRYRPILASLSRGAGGREYRITFGRFASRAKADRVVIQLREAGMLGRIRVIRTR